MVERDEIKGRIFQHFKDLYMEKDETNPLTRDNFLYGIPSLSLEQDNKDLSKSIMDFDIKDAIWSLQSDKAPRPDGFTINFYIESWDIIKE